MKTIIAGSRDITQWEFVEKLIDSCPWKSEITEVVSGTANGVDKLGEKYAEKHGIPIKRFPADWSLGKQAGYLRNKQMGDYADAVILIHKNGSKGTQHMKDIAEEKGLKIHYVEVRDKETFSLSQLKDLQKQTEGMDMIGGALFKRILNQYVKQMEEYQIVVRDCRVMMKALESMGSYERNSKTIYVIDEELTKKALETPTAKLLQSLNANNQ